VCWLVTAVQPTFELFCEQARATIQPRYYMGLQLTRAALTTGLGVAFIKLGMGWWGPLLGMAVGNALPAFYAFGHDWRGIRLGIDFNLLAAIARYGIPLSLTVGLTIVISNSDRYVIAYFLGKSAEGIYAAAADFTTQTLTLLMMAISLAILPLAMKAYEDHGPDAAREQMRHNATLLLAIGVPAVVGLMLLAGNVSHCFLGKDFRQEAARIMPIIAFGTFLAGYKAYHLDSAFQFVHRTIYQVWIVLIAAVVNVALNFLVVRRYGIIGAASASVVAYVVSMVLTASYGRKHFALPFPTREFLKVLAASCAMAAALYLLRDYRGSIALAGQVSAGGMVYGLVLIAFNFFDLRGVVLNRLTGGRIADAPVVAAVRQVASGGAVLTDVS
jgi:O-antigen/teichoic acid export membrane protein